MIFHGRYRVVRRKPADLRRYRFSVGPVVAEAWELREYGEVVGTYTAKQIREMTGESPEENARGGWRCFWQESRRAE